MNNELIKRIDEALGQFGISTAEWDLLADCRAEIERLESRIAELEKPYVPMTDDERHTAFTEAEMNRDDGLSAIEAAVIKRAGLEIKQDDV